ncbi:hypothetical protein [Helicobacter sp.]|uniref:hypothetical protein n=1 Tax=Helicobacter sp. TaxID=218 RepID=UPI0025BC68C9|nr:hypothetical protein [Helicobacter sp.]MBR2495530.1 hypothetical protein [Helicobacter sp.]
MLMLVQIVHNKPLYTLYAHEVKSCKTQQILDKATKKQSLNTSGIINLSTHNKNHKHNKPYWTSPYTPLAIQ